MNITYHRRLHDVFGRIVAWLDKNGSLLQLKLVDGRIFFSLVFPDDVANAVNSYIEYFRGIVDTYKDTVLQALKGEEFAELETKWANELEIEWNEKAKERYAPKEINIAE